MVNWKNVRRKIRYRFIYLAVRGMIFLSNLMPRKVWIAICGYLGGLGYFVASQSRRITLENLKRAYPNIDNQSRTRLAKNVFVMLGRNAGDVLRAFPITQYERYKRIRDIEGEIHLDEAYKKGRGVLFLTAHLGAFELVATEMAFRGYQPLIIGTAMKDERLTDLLWRQRSKLGATAIERGKETVRLMKTLKAGGTVAILIDQDTRVKSVFVDFFGHSCSTPVGAALLALRTGAAVVPVFIHMRSDGKQQITCYSEVELIRTGNEEEDIRANTQLFTSVIESEIRKYPEQWVWMHERWKTRPE
ncbi:MAG: lysophospholipid acyltransferase family protein [Cyclobacteriaceae bacterium]|nr:lysophospholipid acyltransferase family protein [Cyclobacteriaceae bacterium]MDW8330510.1 lysophospholipid acyltransferase family protein [Cyclobacteriaceae bacterium]